MNEKALQAARELISQRYADRRKELGITQEQAAELSGLGVATIKRFESARFWIGLKQLLILSHVYRCYFFVEDMDGETELSEMMRKRWKRDSDNN